MLQLQQQRTLCWKLVRTSNLLRVNWNHALNQAIRIIRKLSATELTAMHYALAMDVLESRSDLAEEIPDGGLVQETCGTLATDRIKNALRSNIFKKQQF